VLHVHRAESTATLAADLAGILSEPPDDPFAPDVVAVPTKGVERWLTQRLSHRLGTDAGDGVCANVAFPSPSRLLADALSAATGVERDDDPWVTGRVTWTLLGVIDANLDQPWCGPLAGHVGGASQPPTPGRRLATAQKLARLFASYAASRPQLILDWTGGDDSDGAGGRLPDDLHWQAELFRRLRAEIDTESPAERLSIGCQAIAADPTLLDLPQRLSVFGPTRLTTADLDVLVAVAAHREVHVWLPHPSPALWRAIADRSDGDTSRRRDDTTTDLTANPLLASLGRDVRELQQRLARHAPGHTDRHLPPPVPAPAGPTSVLDMLQRAIRDDMAPGTAPLTVGDGDRSLAVYACHGADRQVEVLREVLVGLLADDPTLEPRDVLVMCPNIEDYAPLIAATFGTVDDDDTDVHPGHRLRVRLADRSLRQTNPMLGLLANLLELAAGRVTASEVLDLAALPPVRRRFGLTDDHLERLRDWVAAAGIRWGVDAAHRRPFQLDAVAQNTWRAGLDRILLGATMDEDDLRYVGLALPLDDVDSNDVALAGRLAELLDRLIGVLDRLTGAHPLDHWLDTLADALDLLGHVPEAEMWQVAQARRELGELRVEATAASASVTVSLGDMRALFGDRLAGRPTRANFRTGSLTMCSMLPMRSVPHRVVCLLGLDDGAFPRGQGIDGDDVLARDPCLGERDPNSEDRQLFLDAILAAREHLVITYAGADARTNARKPPAVPVGELLDAVDALAVTADGRPANEHIVVRMPLQPFDPSNFVAAGLGARERPFSFDRVALAGAQRAERRRDPLPRFLAAPLDPPPVTDGETGDVSLDDLVYWLEHPCRGFLRQRLALSLPHDDDQLSDAITIELKGLEKWAVGDRVLDARLAGIDVDRCRQAEWRRGALPPGALGTRTLTGVIDDVEPLVAATTAVLTDAGESIDITVDLGGRAVAGTVSNVHGQTIVRATFSNLGAKHRLRAWVQLLALTAAEPGATWIAVTVGNDPRGTGQRSTLGPVDPVAARDHLADLVALRDTGLCAPLPIATKASAEYAARRSRMTPDNALARAGQVWAGKFPEDDDEAHRIIWGEQPSIDVLAAAAAEPGEPYGDEGSRFGQLARRIWQPLLDAETLDGL
jgi:exodeoxyribonuclease V gamma subunit